MSITFDCSNKSRYPFKKGLRKHWSSKERRGNQEKGDSKGILGCLTQQIKATLYPQNGQRIDWRGFDSLTSQRTLRGRIKTHQRKERSSQAIGPLNPIIQLQAVGNQITWGLKRERERWAGRCLCPEKAVLGWGEKIKTRINSSQKTRNTSTQHRYIILIASGYQQ